MFKQAALTRSTQFASQALSKASNQVTSLLPGPLTGNLTLLASALALALSAGSAQAASTSSATLGPISIATSGGSVTFDYYDPSYYYYATQAYASVYDSASGESASDGQSSTEFYGPVTASSVITHAGASASALAGADTASPAGASFAASGYSNGKELADNYNYSHYTANVYSNYYGYTAFTIDPNTTATFSAVATVSAATTIGYDPSFVSTEYANASAYLYAYVSGNNPVYDASLSTSAWYDYSYDPDTGVYTYFGTSDNRSGLLEVSVSNTSDEVQYGYFYGYASVYGYSYEVTAVPEPDSYAMLLAGLGMLGFAARHRMKQGQA